jgi:hypothetical protein
MAIQIAGFNRRLRQEKAPPWLGESAAPLANLIQESSRVNPNMIYTVEVEKPEDVPPSMEMIAENYRG